MKLALVLLLFTSFPAYATSIPIPERACGTAQCDLIFNFDFTSPPQSVTPPYVLIGFGIPVLVLNPATFFIDLFSGLNGTDVRRSFSGDLPAGDQPIGIVSEFIASDVGAQDGIFSIGISTSRAGAGEVSSAPLAQAFGGSDCTIASLSTCSSVIITPIGFGPVPEPATIFLICGGLVAMSLLRRRP
jgi:PEP-CTERM motif